MRSALSPWNGLPSKIVDEAANTERSDNPMLDLSAAEAIVDVKDAAEYAGLTYVSDEKPGIRRRRKGKGFWYENAQGTKVTDEPTLKRIKALAVPPAWTDVWICPKAKRPRAGDRPGCQGAQAIPVSCPLSRGARRHKV